MENTVWFGEDDQMRFEKDGKQIKCVVNDGDIYFTVYLTSDNIMDLIEFFEKLI